ncbi:MAG: PEP-CTERM sorting domain-containing protein [Bryobacterales bacterium]|nr:PEP-CTERM sorting domain-containing protein [Bryobacterales bacterium]
MRKLILAGCALALTSVSYAATFAGVANGVYNTGVNNSSVVLSGGAVATQYTIVKLPAGCSGVQCDEDLDVAGIDLFGPASYVILDGYPVSGPVQPWLSNDSTSKWIGPRADQDPALVPTSSIYASQNDFYVYRMVFNLTALGLNPATANLQFRWASDNPSNQGIPPVPPVLNSHVRMCGVSSATDPECGSGSTIAGSNSAGFSAWTSTITVNSGFVGGLMALDFVVYNSVVPDGNFNPSGLRVEIISATADVDTGIPEPSTYALIGSALAGLALLRRRS